MNKYFTITPNIALRLRGKIFNGMSSEIYGEEIGRIGHEDEFARVRSALAHLLRNVYFEPTVAVAEKISALKAAHDALMEHHPTVFSPKKKAVLNGLIQQIMELSKATFNETFTVEDVRRFVSLARQGREYFETEGYNPEEFIPEELVIFGEMIKANFSAYQKTLNAEYL